MEHLLTLLRDNIADIGVLLIVCVSILFILLHDWNTIRRKAKHARSIYYQNFLKDWDTYRSIDRPGCYIILIYRRRPLRHTAQKCKRYNEVYIGQSVNMHKRVYNHLTGHGNGDVYADVKYGRHVYVKFIPCIIEQLNIYEKGLIDEFEATNSYNRTKGGAKITVR